jgi:hypothetical protein
MGFLHHIALTEETEEIEVAVGIMKKEMAGLQNENCILRPDDVPRRFLR